MDPYQLFTQLYLRSDDHSVSGSGDLSDGHAAGGHSDAAHHGHAHPGTVLFLFVAIAVGGKKKKERMMIIVCIVVFFLGGIVVCKKCFHNFHFVPLDLLDRQLTNKILRVKVRIFFVSFSIGAPCLEAYPNPIYCHPYLPWSCLRSREQRGKAQLPAGLHGNCPHGPSPYALHFPPDSDL